MSHLSKGDHFVKRNCKQLTCLKKDSQQEKAMVYKKKFMRFSGLNYWGGWKFCLHVHDHSNQRHFVGGSLAQCLQPSVQSNYNKKITWLLGAVYPAFCPIKLEQENHVATWRSVSSLLSNQTRTRKSRGYLAQCLQPSVQSN